MSVSQTKKNEAGEHGSEIKPHNYTLQPIEPINAPKIQDLIHTLEGKTNGSPRKTR